VEYQIKTKKKKIKDTINFQFVDKFLEYLI